MQFGSFYTIFASCVAALGGLLFGYNTSVISGALLFISQDFNLSTFQQELVVSTFLIGCVIGAFWGGFLADFLGRKKTLFATLILFFFGIFILSDSVGFDTLLLGRFISGLAIGISSLCTPLYIAEIAPHERRGVLVSLNQLMITIGILVAYLVSYRLANQNDWRDMFAFAYFPAAVQFAGLFFIPESPSWLLGQNRHADAEKVFKKMDLPLRDQQAVREGDGSGLASKMNWRELFSSRYRRSFLVGVGISVFQQITGINTVIYYAPKIFQLAGYQTAQTAIFATIFVGIINVVMTVISLWLIDRWGRRPLLVGGLLGMATALALLGFSFLGAGADMGYAAVAGLMIYVAFFAISLGPVAWLIISEIYPLGIRGRAMGIATLANWICNYIVSLTFLTLIEVLGTGYTFWLYTIICLIGLWFVLKMVPETKGKTLEQIQNFWRK